METEETGVITRHQIPVMMSKKTVVLRASDFIRGYRDVNMVTGRIIAKT